MDANPLTPDDLTRLSRLATTLTESGDPAGELLAQVLRDRGRTRVVARKVLVALPDDILHTADAHELFELLSPWPTCRVRAA